MRFKRRALPVQYRRPSWWMYILGFSFLFFFAVQVYFQLFGPELFGISLDNHGGFTVIYVDDRGPAARAGLQPGDRIVAVDGILLRHRPDWGRVGYTLQVGYPHRLDIERDGKFIQLTIILGRKSPHEWGLVRMALLCGDLIVLCLAFVIAFRRPYDAIARVGSWFLATVAISTVPVNFGGAPFWRSLPLPLGALLWLPSFSGLLLPGIYFLFFSMLPRPFFRIRWWWWVVLYAPLLFFAGLQLVGSIRGLYHPIFANNAPWWPAPPINFAVDTSYTLAALVVLVFNYRRLQDVSERRRVRVLVAGSVIGIVGPLVSFFFLFVGGRPAQIFFSTPLPLVCGLIFLAFPLSFAYAMLHHRVLDVGIIVRQGIQYALTRKVLLFAVPALIGIVVLDLLTHGDQPMISVIRDRGWGYLALAVLAAITYINRARWLHTLDRRFFRERYDSQRLLLDIMEEARRADSLIQMGPQVVGHIDEALHPEFVNLLMREAQQGIFVGLAARPPGHKLPGLRTESKLSSIVRLLGKPLDIPQTSSLLVNQLPSEDAAFLRENRIEVLVPIVAAEHNAEAMLALGSKRSEEPYTHEDMDLLAAIGSGLSLLLERPFLGGASRIETFAECPECGTCYDSDSSRCAREDALLTQVVLPRLLAGRYKLERRLGRGGMGTVYAALDTALERRVAIKLIREDLVGNMEGADRFRREARIAAGFAHPNLVTVYDFGVVVGNRAFLVMELLAGETLRAKLFRTRSVAPPIALSIVKDLCSGLGAAHNRDLVHRDLKPENVFLVAHDPVEYAKLLDFGIAKFCPSAALESTVTAHTAPGAMLGTPRYMSPEQLRGAPPAPAWDLWALAVIAYEMLTGSHPFQGDAFVELLHSKGTIRFTPVMSYAPEAPSSWQEFFEHTFAPEPGRRPQTAETFLSELQIAIG